MAAPVGVAQTLPGLHAGAAHAARVGDALVAVLALPAVQAPAGQRTFSAGGTKQNAHMHNPQKENK